MKNLLKTAAVAALLAGASLFAAAPAQADSFGIRIGSGIGFSYDSGGYCDSYGCPDGFWDYEVAYCPVFVRGQWYRGPVYYRRMHGDYYYWVHGGWHRDEWNARRPAWACEDRFGPALGFDFYQSHGFRWHDEWRQRWFRDHGGRGDHRGGDWNRGGDRNDRGGDWNRDGDHGDHNDHGDRHGGHDDNGGANPFAPFGSTGGTSGGSDNGRHRHDGDTGGSNATPAGSTGGSSTTGGSNTSGSAGGTGTGASGGHHHDGGASNTTPTGTTGAASTTGSNSTGSSGRTGTGTSGGHQHGNDANGTTQPTGDRHGDGTHGDGDRPVITP